MALFAEIRARAWQFGAITASAAAVVCATGWGVTTLQKRSAEKLVAELRDDVENPVSGYVVRLASCQGNLMAMNVALDSQNTAIEQLHKDSDARIAQAEAGLAAAQRSAADARYRAERLAGAQISGNTVCERVEDADRQVLEMLR